MNSKLFNLIYEKSTKLGHDELSKKAILNILPSDDEIIKIDYIPFHSEPVYIYKVKNSVDYHIMRVGIIDDCLTISTIKKGEYLKKAEKIRIINDDVIYNSISRIVGENGVCITGSNANLELNKTNKIVPKDVYSGIWFYDEKFIKYINETMGTIEYLFNYLDPVFVIEDMNIKNYLKSNVLPDLHKTIKANIVPNKTSNDSLKYIIEKEDLDGSKDCTLFECIINEDFRKNIKQLYKTNINESDIEKKIIENAKIQHVSCEDLGLFEIHYNGISNKEYVYKGKY